MALRLTVQVLLVMQALLREPGRERYGLELSEETGLLPARLSDPAAPGARGLGDQPLGEDVDRRLEKRPARRYYRLTASGAAQASAAVANARRPRGAALRGLASEGGTA